MRIAIIGCGVGGMGFGHGEQLDLAGIASDAGAGPGDLRADGVGTLGKFLVGYEHC